MKMDVVSRNVRLLRANLGLEQQELAELAGVNPATVSRLEKGKTRRPRAAELDQIAKALGSSSDAIQQPLRLVPESLQGTNGPRTTGSYGDDKLSGILGRAHIGSPSAVAAIASALAFQAQVSQWGATMPDDGVYLVTIEGDWLGPEIKSGEELKIRLKTWQDGDRLIVRDGDRLVTGLLTGDGPGARLAVDGGDIISMDGIVVLAVIVGRVLDERSRVD